MSHSKEYYFERFIPEACFIIVLTLTYIYSDIIPVNTKDLSGSFAAIFAVFVGFITTSISIFFSAQDKQFIKSMKSSGSFAMIVSYHHMAIMWCSVAVVASLVCTVFCDNCSNNNFVTAIKGVMFSTSFAAFVSMVRVGYFYKKIILRN